MQNRENSRYVYFNACSSGVNPTEGNGIMNKDEPGETNPAYMQNNAANCCLLAVTVVLNKEWRKQT